MHILILKAEQVFEGWPWCHPSKTAYIVFHPSRWNKVLKEIYPEKSLICFGNYMRLQNANTHLDEGCRKRSGELR